jgi:hypothetical protein
VYGSALQRHTKLIQKPSGPGAARRQACAAADWQTHAQDFNGWHLCPGRGGPASRVTGSRLTAAKLGKVATFTSLLAPWEPRTITLDSSIAWDEVDPSPAIGTRHPIQRIDRVKVASGFSPISVRDCPELLENRAMRAPTASLSPQRATNHPFILGSSFCSSAVAALPG